MLLDAVAGRQTLEIVLFHHARCAPAFGRADHIYQGDVLEYFCDRQFCSHFYIRWRGQAALANVALRFTVGFRRQGHAGSCAIMAALRLEIGRDMTAFRPRCLSARAWPENRAGSHRSRRVPDPGPGARDTARSGARSLVQSAPCRRRPVSSPLSNPTIPAPSSQPLSPPCSLPAGYIERHKKRFIICT